MVQVARRLANGVCCLLKPICYDKLPSTVRPARHQPTIVQASRHKVMSRSYLDAGVLLNPSPSPLFLSLSSSLSPSLSLLSLPPSLPLSPSFPLSLSLSFPLSPPFLPLPPILCITCTDYVPFGQLRCILPGNAGANKCLIWLSSFLHLLSVVNASLV